MYRYASGWVSGLVKGAGETPTGSSSVWRPTFLPRLHSRCRMMRFSPELRVWFSGCARRKNTHSGLAGFLTSVHAHPRLDNEHELEPLWGKKRPNTQLLTVRVCEHGCLWVSHWGSGRMTQRGSRSTLHAPWVLTEDMTDTRQCGYQGWRTGFRSLLQTDLWFIRYKWIQTLFKIYQLGIYLGNNGTFHFNSNSIWKHYLDDTLIKCQHKQYFSCSLAFLVR